MSPRSSTRTIRRSVPSSPLYAHLIRLLFFVVTFVVFVALQNSLAYFGQIWDQLQNELTGVPWWIIVLAAIGTLPVFWILFLGVDQLIRRIAGNRPDFYEGLSSDSELEDSSDVEDGRRFQKKYSNEPIKKRSESTLGASPSSSGGRSQKSGRSSSQAHPGSGESNRGNYASGQQSGGQGRTGDDQDSENPTDVDVTVHPVDTTIAAGGEARVSPTYNVSLMNFSNDPPGTGSPYDTGRIYPSAPAMIQGGPAYFKRGF